MRWLCFGLLLVAAIGNPDDGLPAAAHRGVCWVGNADRPSLEYLRTLGVEWFSVTPYAYGQRQKDQAPAGGFQWSNHRGESIEAARELARLGKELGFKVMFKPHVWFSRGGEWHGDIAMQNAADWQAWFSAYGEFLAPFVTIAQEEQIEAFCIGTELPGTTGARPDLWRALIAKVRANYRGSITYAAHWDGEFERVAFWDQLDWIGVQSYFPLTDKSHPTVTELRAGWAPWLARIEAVARKAKKPVLFPELGYRPVVGTAIKPWEYRDRGEPDPEAQANAYEAFFQALGNKEWFLGCHVWKWFAGYTGPGSRPRRRQDFSPQGLEGEQVLGRWFRRPVATPAGQEPGKSR
jgi:hypothetical protein